ncbi:hypothetical protein Mp_2g25600 [Marchantia polymorpha subsp. ruderalis]|nr:hypothetical protein MARPO_0025s0117 [Marchantia polymorpha]BBN03696.1 hypothetical protein Mp_2g25600 [Marchantia polymorpha subsp. ruderalis]|eukprot:PTQ43435.1 hypothetical protein MARPO_0025s0117 [Marchantia polymorpha]
MGELGDKESTSVIKPPPPWNGKLIVKLMACWRHDPKAMRPSCPKAAARSLLSRQPPRKSRTGSLES